MFASEIKWLQNQLQMLCGYLLIYFWPIDSYLIAFSIDEKHLSFSSGCLILIARFIASEYPHKRHYRRNICINRDGTQFVHTHTHKKKEIIRKNIHKKTLWRPRKWIERWGGLDESNSCVTEIRNSFWIASKIFNTKFW